MVVPAGTDGLRLSVLERPTPDEKGIHPDEFDNIWNTNNPF